MTLYKTIILIFSLYIIKLKDVYKELKEWLVLL